MCACVCVCVLCVCVCTCGACGVCVLACAVVACVKVEVRKECLPSVLIVVKPDLSIEQDLRDTLPRACRQCVYRLH